MKPFVRQRAEIESVTGYFHDFSTSGWAAHAAAIILRIWKFKNKRFPFVGSDCKWPRCQFHRIVRWPRPDLAQHCSAAAPRPASACLRSSQVSLTLTRVTLVKLSWPHTTTTHFVTQQFLSHLHVCVHGLVWQNVHSCKQCWEICVCLCVTQGRSCSDVSETQVKWTWSWLRSKKSNKQDSSGNSSRLEPHLLSL